jgi:hypothetical protein
MDPVTIETLVDCLVEETEFNVKFKSITGIVSIFKHKKRNETELK